MNTQETEALATELAGTKCPRCGGTGDAASGGWSCLSCHGTGYLFDDSVRVLCPPALCQAGVLQVDYKGQKLGDAHKPCAGRGWTASRDSMTWHRALKAVGALSVAYHLRSGVVMVEWYPDRMPGWSREATALLTALAQGGATCNLT